MIQNDYPTTHRSPMPPLSTPNILLILADQHRWDCLGANGHPLLRTPNIDRLADEGMNFSHAFTPSPICVPTRASLLTGTWSTRHLSIANPDTEAPRPFRADLPTFSQALNAAGYWLGWVGKWQIDPSKSPLDFGFHQYEDDRQYGAWRAAQGLAPKPRRNRWFGELDPSVTPEQTRLGWGANQIISMLEARTAGAAGGAIGQPFFLRWDTNEPHLPNILPEPFYSMYSPQAIEPWASWGDPLLGKPYIQAKMRRTWDVDAWTWQDWAPIVSRYLGEISLLDAQVGRILAALDRLGLAENTLVIFSSDHGDMCGAHGMIDKHYIMYDDVMRVPLLARWPGRIAPGSRSDGFVCHALDLAVTFCDAAGQPVPDTFQGRSLLPLMAGAQGERDDIFGMYHGNQFGLYSQRMLRDRRWKYIMNATAEDELYDLELDPGEIHNLATEPAAADELARLRRRMLAWMEDARDPLLNEWIRSTLENNR